MQERLHRWTRGFLERSNAARALDLATTPLAASSGSPVCAAATHEDRHPIGLALERGKALCTSHRRAHGPHGPSRFDHRETYPRRQQMAHGAFLRLVGSDALVTKRALLKSATRRRLYECGEYVPTVYTVVWPRDDMLRWSATRSRPSPS